MRFTTSSGWETIATWSVGTSTVGCAHAAGELPLGIGRDRLVTVGDKEPGRQRLPGRDTHHLLEGAPVQRLLDREHDPGLDWIDIGCEVVDEVVLRDPGEAVLVDVEVRQGGVGGPWPSRAIYSPSSSPNPSM